MAPHDHAEQNQNKMAAQEPPSNDYNVLQCMTIIYTHVKQACNTFIILRNTFKIMKDIFSLKSK